MRLLNFQNLMELHKKHKELSSKPKNYLKATEADVQYFIYKHECIPGFS